VGSTTTLRALLSLLVAVVLTGCTGSDGGRSAASTSPTAAPSALGGPRPARHPVPRAPMDALERPVAARLATRIAPQGLTVDYLDCPRWDRRVPARMTCKGYVDGLVVPVSLRLRAEVAGAAVGFDAHLAAGVVATRRLVEMLVDREGGRADCGDVPAYPARVGSAIVCRIRHGGGSSYVVATVRSRSGEVSVADYRGTGTGR
jgi:hypothetical protein